MPRPTTLREPWRTLAIKVGGVGALAKRMHSSERTIRAWSKGERRMSGPAQALFEQLKKEFDIQE